MTNEKWKMRNGKSFCQPYFDPNSRYRGRGLPEVSRSHTLNIPTIRLKGIEVNVSQTSASFRTGIGFSGSVFLHRLPATSSSARQSISDDN
jgi:hypothetical protein